MPKIKLIKWCCPIKRQATLLRYMLSSPIRGNSRPGRLRQCMPIKPERVLCRLSSHMENHGLSIVIDVVLDIFRDSVPRTISCVQIVTNQTISLSPAGTTNGSSTENLKYMVLSVLTSHWNLTPINRSGLVRWCLFCHLVQLADGCKSLP
uniref:Uncharacterized protein n=1 Tax=Cacopsylla melanoneura TaxID=428564 RepID=A0A8D8TQX6_9HEMI